MGAPGRREGAGRPTAPGDGKVQIRRPPGAHLLVGALRLVARELREIGIEIGDHAARVGDDVRVVDLQAVGEPFGDRELAESLRALHQARMRRGGQLLSVGGVQLVEPLGIQRGDQPGEVGRGIGDLGGGPVADRADLLPRDEQGLLREVPVHELRGEVPQLLVLEQRLPALRDGGGQMAGLRDLPDPGAVLRVQHLRGEGLHPGGLGGVAGHGVDPGEHLAQRAGEIRPAREIVEHQRAADGGLRHGAAPALGELHEAEHRRGHTAERGAGERVGHLQVALEAHTGGGRGGGEGHDPSAVLSHDAGDVEILHRGGDRHGPHRDQPGDRRRGEGSQGIGVAMHASTVPGEGARSA